MANKSHAPPNVPGKTEFEKFDNFVRAVIAVPKAVIDREEKKWKRARARKQAKAKKAS
jgi:hypothetical protein